MSESRPAVVVGVGPSGSPAHRYHGPGGSPSFRRGSVRPWDTHEIGLGVYRGSWTLSSYTATCLLGTDRWTRHMPLPVMEWKLPVSMSKLPLTLMCDHVHSAAQTPGVPPGAPGFDE